jgi:hypothetical protein
MNLLIDSEAVFSPCRSWRYLLIRRWADGPLANFCMLNPSDADEKRNDATVERQCRRVMDWGYSGLIVTNAFALVSKDPRMLGRVADPVGPENDRYILQAAQQAGIVVCAWGSDPILEKTGRGRHVRQLLAKHKVHYLKMTKKGEPCHPLYINYNVAPKEWK